MTVNLILSLGLAGADAWAATLVLLGLVVNSYLPIVHGITLGRWSVCYFLVFELVRLAGMVTSNMHLFALALNHWFSIASPLRYKTAVTTGWCRTVMFLLWLLPLFVMVIAAVCVPGQGFRGGGAFWCNIDFYFRFPFRLVIFLQFIIPLVTMLAIYGYILHRLAMVRNAPKAKPDSYQRQSLVLRPRKSGDGTTSNGSAELGMHRRSGGQELRVSSRSNALQSKIKALTTTLLILGTFAIGWLPAVMQFTLVCIDCAISYYPPRHSLFAVGVVVNCLIIVKLLINPLIYAFRILEIRYALWHMHKTRYGLRPVPPHANMPEEFRNLDGRRRTVRGHVILEMHAVYLLPACCMHLQSPSSVVAPMHRY